MTERLALPQHEPLGDWRDRLSPPCVLDACRQQLRRVPREIRRRWRDCRVVEALYHPGRYIRVAYALLDDLGTAFCRLWPEGQIVYLHTPVRRPMSRRGQIVRIGGVEAEAYHFPNDRRLRGLRRFAGRREAARTWQHWLEPADDPIPVDPESIQRLLVRYVPEQKWIVRLRASVPQPRGPIRKRRIAVRSTAPGVCHALRNRHALLAAWAGRVKAPLIVPRAVGSRLSDGLLATEWVRGRTLVDALRGGAADAMLRALARVLTTFHHAPCGGLEPLTPTRLRTRLTDAVQDIAAAEPGLSPELLEIAREMERRTAALEAWQRLNGRFDAERYGLYSALSLLELARGMMRHLRPEWPGLARLCVQECMAQLWPSDPALRATAGEEAVR